MHYYQFNIGDYAKSTLHLSPLEDLAYRRLLDRYYDTEKPLESDLTKLCRFIRMGSYEKETQQILDEYFSITQKGWIQKRVQKELGAYSAKADAARANGKLGGRPKKTQSVILANPELTQPKAKQEPLTNNHKPITKEIKTIDQNEFDRVWEAYGKKGNKKTSLAKYSKLSETSRANIFSHIPNYVLSTPEKQYRKNFETYINQECWNDEVIHENTTRPTQPKPSAVDRVKQAIARETEQQGDFDNQPPLDSPIGNIRGGVCEPIRGNAKPELEGFIEGDFSRTDQDRS